MKPRRLPILASLALAYAFAAKPPSGKDLFVARCASCHGERGDKPLTPGPPLSERKLSQETIAKAVRGRMKQNSEAERKAVVLYIASLQQPP